MKDIYLTSSLHNKWNIKFNTKITSALENKRFTVYLPQRDTNQKGEKENIWKEDIAAMDNARIILAVALNEGVNWGAEVGYAYGKKQKIVCLTTKEHIIPLIANHMITKIVRVENLDSINSYIEEIILDVNKLINTP